MPIGSQAEMQRSNWIPTIQLHDDLLTRRNVEVLSFRLEVEPEEPRKIIADGDLFHLGRQSTRRTVLINDVASVYWVAFIRVKMTLICVSTGVIVTGIRLTHRIVFS